MKNKIGLLLIIFSIFLYVNKQLYYRNNVIYQNKIINKTKDNHLEKVEYIEIPKYNIRRIIKNDISNNILDNYYVGYMKINNPNLIVIAGHDINLVFHKIHYLKDNDTIYINNNKYIVYDYKEIDINDYSDINKKYDKKTLMLITCTNDKNKRYIVLAHFPMLSK